MSRVFIKQVPRLVRQHLPHVQSLGATAVVEALEDVAHLRERDDSVDDFLTHCISRALALLPELRVSGVVRALFAYKRAERTSTYFLEEVARFLLEECGPGQPFETFFNSCTANDVLLLYKAFVVNEYFDVRLYDMCMDMLEKQTQHMIPSDCCIFFQSHTKCLQASKRGYLTKEGEKVTLEDVLRPSLAREVTMRFLQQQNEAIPGDVAVFVEWLIPGSQYYGVAVKFPDHLAALYLRLSQNPVIFNIDHIHRLVQSTCLFHASMPKEHHNAMKYFIVSLLHEAERRSDLHDFKSALATFYALDRIGLWEFELVQGLLYSIVNNVEREEDLSKVQAIVQRRLQSTGSNEGLDGYGSSCRGLLANFNFTIDRYPSSIQAMKLHEIIERLEARRLYIQQ